MFRSRKNSSKSGITSHKCDKVGLEMTSSDGTLTIVNSSDVTQSILIGKKACGEVVEHNCRYWKLILNHHEKGIFYRLSQTKKGELKCPLCKTICN